MLIVKYNNKKYNVKNETNEILIGEFEDLIETMNSEKNYIDRWSEVFVLLGLPQDVVDDMDSEDFINIIKEMNITIDRDMELTPEIEIEGILYKLKSNEIKISVKDMRFIEDFIIKGKNKYIGDIMAVLYRNEKSDDVINYDLSHIKHKAKLFRENVTVDKSIPFIKYLSTKIVKDYTTIQNEFTTTK